MTEPINPIIKAGGFTYQPQKRPLKARRDKRVLDDVKEFEELFKGILEASRVLPEN